MLTISVKEASKLSNMSELFIRQQVQNGAIPQAFIGTMSRFRTT